MLVMAGTNLPAPAVIVGSINNSEADGGDGPDRGDLGDPLRGVRAHNHNAPAVARSRVTIWSASWTISRSRAASAAVAVATVEPVVE